MRFEPMTLCSLVIVCGAAKTFYIYMQYFSIIYDRYFSTSVFFVCKYF